MMKALSSLLLIQAVIAISIIAADGSTRSAKACSDRGGNYLSNIRKGTSLGQIVEGLNRACPETIEINAGMSGLVVCDSNRILLIEDSNGNLKGRVVGIKRRGKWCDW